MVRSDTFLGVASRSDARLLAAFRVAGLAPAGLAVILVLLAAWDSLTNRPGVTAPTRLFIENNGFGVAVAVAVPTMFGLCGVVSVLVTVTWARRWPVHVLFFSPWFVAMMWVFTAAWPMFASSVVDGAQFVPWSVRFWSLIYLSSACLAIGLGIRRRGRSESFGSITGGIRDDPKRGRAEVWDGRA